MKVVTVTHSVYESGAEFLNQMLTSYLSSHVGMCVRQPHLIAQISNNKMSCRHLICQGPKGIYYLYRIKYGIG